MRHIYRRGRFKTCPYIMRENMIVIDIFKKLKCYQKMKRSFGKTKNTWARPSLKDVTYRGEMQLNRYCPACPEEDEFKFGVIYIEASFDGLNINIFLISVFSRIQW